MEMNELKTLYEKYYTAENVEKIMNALEFVNSELSSNDSIYNIEMSKALSEMLINIRMDSDTIISGILYPYSKCNENGLETIKSRFEPYAFNILSSINKIESLSVTNREEEAQNIKDMFVALAKDVRTIILKLCIEEYKIKNDDKFTEEEQATLYKQANNIYAPLAAMLGISRIKNTLENACFKYFKPTSYNELKEKLENYIEPRNEQLKTTEKVLRQELSSLIPNAEISGRQKQICSIYKKIQNKYHELGNILDIMAVRVIVDTIEECYLALGKVHSIYAPIDHFKDYISNPKANGYQSLHTTVIVENGEPLEIQIRTREMHTYAEYGLAAHWTYKENRKANTSDQKFSYIRSLMDMYKDKSSEELLDMLKYDVYSGDIFVQSPQGKVLKFPEGSTPIDFAYAIHSKIGDHCVGAKVNGKIRPLTSQLQNGDIVEIITNVNAKGPSRDWLNVVKASGSKSKIRAFFKREMKDDNIKKGKSMLENGAKARNILLSNILKDEYLEEVYDKYSLSSLEDMYASIGYGGISSNQVLNKLLDVNRQREVKPIVRPQANTTQSHHGEVSVLGFSNMLTKFANCCKPLPGDEIVGYISRGKGVTIHRKDCSALKHYESERLIPCEWNDYTTNGTFVGSITLICTESMGVLATISKKISDMKINIVGMNTKKLSDNRFSIGISVNISKKEDLQDILTKLTSFDFVLDAYRSK